MAQDEHLLLCRIRDLLREAGYEVQISDSTAFPPFSLVAENASTVLCLALVSEPALLEDTLVRVQEDVLGHLDNRYKEGKPVYLLFGLVAGSGDRGAAMAEERIRRNTLYFRKMVIDFSGLSSGKADDLARLMSPVLPISPGKSLEDLSALEVLSEEWGKMGFAPKVIERLRGRVESGEHQFADLMMEGCGHDEVAAAED
jgi:hypothetical protein